MLLAVNVTQENHHISGEDELTIVLLPALAARIFGALAVMCRHRLNAVVYILGAGVLFGFVAVLTRVIGRHIWTSTGCSLLNVPWYTLLAIIAAGGLGSWFVQSAYSSGSPDLVIAG